MRLAILHRHSGVELYSGEAMSLADLVARAVAEKVNLSGVNLSGADLSDTHLSGAHLAGAKLAEADLSGANLSNANLTRADLSNNANLSNANLLGADLLEADLSGTDLSGANLSWANLSRTDLSEADLSWANLSNANLTRADLSEADLFDYLCGQGGDSRAILTGATMPDGRAWELYRADPLAGICDEPDARNRAIDAWGNHLWTDCPLHAAHGYTSIADAPEDKRIMVAAFVAVFDAKLLPKPDLPKPDAPKPGAQ